MNQRFDVQGMTCQHCARAVEDAIQSLDAEATVNIDLPTGQVNVQSQHAWDALASAITEAGYTVQN